MANFGTPKRAIRLAPAVTATVMDQGIILSYIRSTAGTGAGPFQLPWITTVAPASIFGQVPAAGKIIYYVQTVAGTGAAAPASTFQFRYVIVPGGTPGRMMNGVTGGYSIDQLRSMSYEQVVQLLNIPAEGSNLNLE
jgi:hypothetical protein